MSGVQSGKREASQAEEQAMNNTNDLLEKIGLRFTSGNSMPVDRAHITADEWGQIQALLRALQRPSVWQPMSTAPRDGTTILLRTNDDWWTVGTWDAFRTSGLWGTSDGNMKDRAEDYQAELPPPLGWCPIPEWDLK